MRIPRLLLVAATVAAMAGLVAPPAATGATTPLWVKHVQRYSGGISNGVRFSLDPAVVRAQGRYAASESAPRGVGTNVQMNDDSSRRCRRTRSRRRTAPTIRWSPSPARTTT